ncbi:hypothetical protein LNP02_28355 [Klebsiella variicola subsp. variicola]|nr:hypothetical protein [Klebsiella variicola subsp. variicola]
MPGHQRHRDIGLGAERGLYGQRPFAGQLFYQRAGESVSFSGFLLHRHHLSRLAHFGGSAFFLRDAQQAALQDQNTMIKRGHHAAGGAVVISPGGGLTGVMNGGQ